MHPSVRPAAYPRRAPSSAFTLVELVIVIALIALLAGIAVTRVSRGAAGANESALARNLCTLRTAIDHYHTEHGAYPSAADIGRQLTQYTDRAGAVFKEKTSPGLFGPYLRKLPPMTAGPQAGRTKIGVADGPGIGWIYNPANGTIHANSGDSGDATGKLYRSF